MVSWCKCSPFSITIAFLPPFWLERPFVNLTLGSLPLFMFWNFIPSMELFLIQKKKKKKKQKKKQTNFLGHGFRHVVDI